MRSAASWKLPWQVDTRSLAALRIGLGACVLGDLCTRLGSARMFYTDDGVLPRTAIARAIANTPHLGIYTLSGELWWTLCLFVATALVALFFLFGVWTRLSNFLLWLLLASLHARNGAVLQGGDIILLIALFWSWFMPLGNVWSVDASARSVPRREPILNAGSVAFTLQLFTIYFTSGVLKLRMEYWRAGQAVYNALSADHFVTPFGEWLYQFEAALVWLTYATLALELFVPFLLFVPFHFGKLRSVLVLSFVAFHLGLGASLDLGLFPWVSAVIWTFALPTESWDRLGVSRWVRAGEAWFRGWVSPLGPVWARFTRLTRVAWRERLAATAKRWRAPRAQELLCVAAMAYAALLATAELFPRSLPAISEARPTEWLRIWQSWRMFVPPYRSAGWVVAVGTDAKGTTRNVLFDQGGRVTWERPASVASTFPDQRWRKYLVNLTKAQFRTQRPRLGAALCRDWNTRHPQERVEDVEVVYLRRSIGLHYHRGNVERDSWVRHRCPK